MRYIFVVWHIYDCFDFCVLYSSSEALQHHEVEHVFTVDIVGVHQLTLPSQQSLWGDSDCYVQYRFLTSSSSRKEKSVGSGGFKDACWILQCSIGLPCCC